MADTRWQLLTLLLLVVFLSAVEAAPLDPDTHRSFEEIIRAKGAPPQQRLLAYIKSLQDILAKSII